MIPSSDFESEPFMICEIGSQTCTKLQSFFCSVILRKSPIIIFCISKQPWSDVATLLRLLQKTFIYWLKLQEFETHNLINLRVYYQSKQYVSSSLADLLVDLLLFFAHPYHGGIIITSCTPEPNSTCRASLCAIPFYIFHFQLSQQLYSEPNSSTVWPRASRLYTYQIIPH